MIDSLSTGSTARCAERVFYILYSVYRIPIQSIFTLPPFPPNHVTAQPIGPWAKRRAGPNRKALLVLLIAFTSGLCPYCNSTAHNLSYQYANLLFEFGVCQTK
jgi:hypothetical protein